MNQCEVDAINSLFPAPLQKLFFYVPVQVFTGGTFTVSGPTSPITLYINSSGTVPATPVNLQINPVNGFSGPINFTAPAGVIVVSGSASVNSNASTTAQINIQATALATPQASPVPVYLYANGQLVLTLYAIIQTSANSTFSLTPTPPDRNGNALGEATYLLNVTGPANSTTQLPLIPSELPSGTIYAFSTTAVTGPGASVLTVRNPLATSKFSFHAKGTNGTATLQPMLSLNPMVGSTGTPAVMIDPWGAIPTCSPTFVWDSGVGVTRYQLLVDNTPIGKNRGKIMRTRNFVVIALTVAFLAGQARKGAQPPDEEGFRDAVNRWAEGLKIAGMKDADNRAEGFAIAQEDIAIPILVGAIKTKLRDKRDLSDKQTEFFILVAVDLITYNAGQRAVDAVADLCLTDPGRCPHLVNKVLSQGMAQQHPFGTAYDVVERYSNLRELLLPWVQEWTLKDPSMARRFARELLKREKAGHPISENDVILSRLEPATREAVSQAVLTERIEENQRRND